MSGKDNDDGKGGFPEDVLRQMRDSHEKFIREVERQTDTLSRDSANVFVSFKDFIDANFTSIFNSFRSLPNNIAELRQKMQDEQEMRRQEELEFMRRWTGVEDATPDSIADMLSCASRNDEEDSGRNLAWAYQTSMDCNENVDPRKIEQLYEDGWQPDPALSVHSTPMLSPLGASEYMRENGNDGYNMVATANASHWRWGGNDHRWLSPAWFKRSKYSPVNLQLDDESKDAPFNWKVAFEDLICASLGKDCFDHWQERRLYHQRETPGIRWMINLFYSGILPPSPHPKGILRGHRLSRFFEEYAPGVPYTMDSHELCRDRMLMHVDAEMRGDPYEEEVDRYDNNIEFNADDHKDEVAATRNSATELDTHEFQEQLRNEVQLFGLNRAEKEPNNRQSPEPALRKVDVLSTLTTTTTTRLPDGTVTRRVTLKQKFADGRQETQVKEHTYHEQSNMKPAEPVTEKEAEPKKSGWFWT